MKYGKVIRFMRLSKRLKQTEVSKMIGVSNSALAHYESEYRAITLENLIRISDACEYEILIKDKEKNKIYRFDDIDIDYDIIETTK